MATKDQVRESADHLFKSCEYMLNRGQNEYAFGGDNAFQNFERIGAELNLDKEVVLAVFARKHWDGIIAWIGGHKSQRESIHGRIQDLIVYLTILNSMIEEGEGE